MPPPKNNLPLLQAKSKLRYLVFYQLKTRKMIRVKRMKVRNVSDIVFVDGRNIEEVRFLFTRLGKLKTFDTVVRELSLLPHPKLPNKDKPKYFKFDSPHIPRPVQRTPVIFDEEKKSQFTRPPAQYDNISREEKIDYYIAQ